MDQIVAGAITFNRGRRRQYRGGRMVAGCRPWSRSTSFLASFGIVPLALEHWGYVLVLSLITFLFVEATKWFDYINRPQTEAGCRVE